jgi:hypothetical protein
MRTKTPCPYVYGDEDEDTVWLRQLVVPEEYLAQQYPSACGGFYRRFESENVVDLVRIRRRRSKQQGRATAQ